MSAKMFFGFAVVAVIAAVAPALSGASVVRSDSSSAREPQDRIQSFTIIESIKPVTLASMMRGWGYSAEIDEDGDVLWKIDDYRTYIMVGGEGSNLLFRAAFKSPETTMARVNDWNKDFRFSRTYLENGNPRLELDLELDGGITTDRLKDFLRTCRASMGIWLDKVVE
jgi:hypothetical protein